MTLRGEIETLDHRTYDTHFVHTLEYQHGYRSAVADVLAIIDSWTANGTPLLTYGAVDDKPASAPSEERPAREKLFAAMAPGMQRDYGPKYIEVEAVVGRALIEAIDTLTAAIREAKR